MGNEPRNLYVLKFVFRSFAKINLVRKFYRTFRFLHPYLPHVSQTQPSIPVPLCPFVGGDSRPKHPRLY